MTIKEASSYLGISESFIRNHIKKGDFESYLSGYPIRLTASEIDIFVLPFQNWSWFLPEFCRNIRHTLIKVPEYFAGYEFGSQPAHFQTDIIFS